MLALTRINLNDVAHVWRRNFDVYIRLWRTEMIAPLFEPFFTVVGFGWGVGSLIAGRVMGMPYLTFVGAGILAFTALLRALFECTYGSYFRMVYQSTFDAVLCTPVEVESLALAELLWGATKALLDAIFVFAVLSLFGAAHSPMAALVPLVFLCGAVWVAGLSLSVTARIRDINYYNFYIAFVFSYLWISGASFPLDHLPKAVQVLAWIVPITSVIDVSRDLMIGRFDWMSVARLLYVAIAGLITAELALRLMRKRLAS